VALEADEPVRAAQARWLVGHVLPPLHREQAWVGLLADHAAESSADPRVTAPRSLHLAGQGLTFARSDWSKSAVWTSFQAGPPISEDHQDADQGHIEIWRGSDALLVDGGDSEGSATSNHNTLLVDDGGRHENYSPNQGVWGYGVKTTRFEDDGAVVVAVGDLGEAYAPSCAADGCKQRSVERWVRTVVYVRPSVLVVHDDLLLERETYGAVWAAHVTTPPVLAGDLASAVVGRSRVDVRTLAPVNAEQTALHEPTPSGEGSHRLNHPWGPMWRIEIASPRGAREREFLQLVTVDAADAAPPPARRIAGVGLRGAEGRVAGRRMLVLFSDPSGPKERAIVLGGGADLVVVAGLEPGKGYEVIVDPRAACTMRVRPSADPAATRPGAGGFLRANVASCGPS
jgi:hypothetical protein